MSNYDDKRAELLRRQRELIAAYGRAISYIFGTDGDPLRFGFTVGLTEHGDGHPELLITGLNADTTKDVLNLLAERVLATGERFEHGQTITDLLVDCPVVIVNGLPTDTLYPGTLYSHYGVGNFTLQQIVWPDDHHRFPWDDGYSYAPDRQPTIATP
jgi:hypothetical protein